MKQIAIKVIKRDSVTDVVGGVPPSDATRPATVSATVTDWIAESRQNRLDEARSSRKTIASWIAEPFI